MRIYCVGQLTADIIVTGVESFHLDVDTMNVDGIVIKNGGDCMNTAIGLARLGAGVDFGGMVGDDMLGRYLRAVLEENGIDVAGLRINSDVPTSSVIVLIQPDGNRAFLYYGGTNRKYGFDDIDMARLRSSSHVHIGGTYQLDLLDGQNAAHLFSKARQLGLTTSMDVTWDPSGRWMSVIEPCLPFLDIFMPSENEAKYITGKDDPVDMAECFLEHGVGTAIIKLGANGAYIKEKNADGFFVPAFKTNVVDTTGAGDSFVAGFLSRYIKGLPVYDCIVFALAVGAHCIREVGATTGIPDEQTILDYIKNNPL